MFRRYMLLGCDVRLSNKSAMFGNALGDLLTTPTRCREALRVLLHLVSRLSNKSAMFGNALGDLLTTPTRCREALRVLLHLVSQIKINQIELDSYFAPSIR